MNIERFHCIYCLGTPFLLLPLLVLFTPLISLTLSVHANETKVLNLEQSLATAKENNLAIQAALENLKAAEAQITASRATMLPRLTANGNYTYFKDVQKSVIQAEGGFEFPVPGEDMNEMQSSNPDNEAELIELEFGAQHNIQGTVSLTQPIFAWRRHYNTYKAAKIGYQAAQEDVNTAYQKLRVDVFNAFYAVLITQEFVKVAEQSLELVEKQLNIAQTAFAAGTATNFDVLRAKVQLANAKSQLIRAKNSVKNAKNIYKTTLNLPLAQEISVQGTFEVKDDNLQLDDLIDIALEKRPEVRKALLNEEIGEKQISIAKTRRLPDLAFFSNYQISHNERLTQMNRIWSLGLQINVPIFDGFATKAAIEQSESILKQSQLGTAQVKTGIESEVRKAFLDLHEARSLIDTQRETVSQAEETVRIATLQFENGMITTVEMTDAQLALMQSKVNRLQAYHDYVIGLVRLEKAIGERIE